MLSIAFPLLPLRLKTVKRKFLGQNSLFAKLRDTLRGARVRRISRVRGVGRSDVT